MNVKKGTSTKIKKQLFTHLFTQPSHICMCQGESHPVTIKHNLMHSLSITAHENARS